MATLPFARPQTAKMLLQALQTLQTLPQAFAVAFLGCSHLFFTAFKAAVCRASNLQNVSAGPANLANAAAGFRCGSLSNPPQTFSMATLPFARPQTAKMPLQALQTLQTLPYTFRFGSLSSPSFYHGNSRSHRLQPSVFYGVQSCRLPGLKPPKCLLQALQTLQTLLPQAFAVAFLGCSHLLLTAFKAAVCRASNPQNASAGPSKPCKRCRTLSLWYSLSNPSFFHGNSRSHRLQPSLFYGVQSCRLPGLKPPKCSCRPCKPCKRCRRLSL